MCAVKLCYVIALTQKYQPINKEEIRLTNGGQGCIKYPFLLTKIKCFPVLPAMAHACLLVGIISFHSLLFTSMLRIIFLSLFGNDLTSNEFYAKENQ